MAGAVVTSAMIPVRPFRMLPNPRWGVPGLVVLPAGGFRRARAAITAWPGYAPTPLHDLPAVAQAAGVAAVQLKDESPRFGLGSFKALGGAYAVANLLAAELARRGVAPHADGAALAAGYHADAVRTLTMTCATEGNHGRSVAWGAQRFGCACVVFVHAGVSQARRAAIAHYGATVQEVPGTYDDSVRASAAAAQQPGWFLVSDTSWPGYVETPRDIMQGYRLMPDEAADQWRGPPPTHAFIGGGVGGAAAAVSVQLRSRWQPAPRPIVVEPEQAACLLASAEQGTPTPVPGALRTVMAGLACGEPSLLAWQELERAAAAFMAVPDAAVAPCMRLLAAQGITAGASGVAGLAGLLLAARDGPARAALDLRRDSRVLLFSTEGATDPDAYQDLLATPPCP